MSQSATTSIIALNMKRGGGGESGPYITVLIPILGMGGGSRPYITVLLPILGMGGGSKLQYYYIPSLGWKGGPDHKLQYYYIPILGMEGGSRPYITVLLINSWDGRGVQTIHYSTIIYQSLGWEGGPDHTLQYY